MSGTRLELVWPNKDKFLLVPKDEDGKPVWVERDHPAAGEVRISDFTAAVGEVSDSNPYSDNLMFQGDSLDVLRILNEVPEYRREYRGKVKLIYIDPPFNTGQAFTHYDDWMEHSTWLSFMRDRLLLMKDLLAADGSIWVHLDDAEVHRMRLLLDEVFGEGMFVSEVSWRAADSSNNDSQTFSNDHNTILVYARSSGWRSNRLPRTARSDAHYGNPDDDPNGPWFPGNVSSPSPRPNLRFPIDENFGWTGTPIQPPTNGWRWEADLIRQKISTGEIVLSEPSPGRSRLMRKTYLKNQSGLAPSSMWSDIEETGHNRQAKYELKKLFPEQPTASLFSTPKPERLIHRILHIGSGEGDVVLDVFAGSGTTAAVAHKMGRRWVTSELSSSTLSDFAQPRLEQVLAGTDVGGVTENVGWAGGGGFRVVTVGPSMYETTPLGVMLADWATNGRFARAVAGQLGFEFEQDAAPFCGSRGRMRLAVLDGAVGIEETRQLVYSLGEKERVTIVAQVILPGVEEFLRESSRGSRVRKAPRDLLVVRRGRKRRDEVTPA